MGPTPGNPPPPPPGGPPPPPGGPPPPPPPCGWPLPGSLLGGPPPGGSGSSGPMALIRAASSAVIRCPVLGLMGSKSSGIPSCGCCMGSTWSVYVGSNCVVVISLGGWTTMCSASGTSLSVIPAARFANSSCSSALTCERWSSSDSSLLCSDSDSSSSVVLAAGAPSRGPTLARGTTSLSRMSHRYLRVVGLMTVRIPASFVASIHQQVCSKLNSTG